MDVSVELESGRYKKYDRVSNAGADRGWFFQTHDEAFEKALAIKKAAQRLLFLLRIISKNYTVVQVK